MPPNKGKTKEVKYLFPKNFLNLSDKLRKQYYVPRPLVVLSGQIVIIEDFFSEALCDELIKSFEDQLKLETTPVVKSKDYATRINDRCSVSDSNASTKLWDYIRQILVQDISYEDDEIQEVKQEFDCAIGLNDLLRIYRYKKGHHFNKHYDESVDCKISGQPSKTKWTLLIYLTGGEEFNGGGTIFYPEDKNKSPLNVHPKKGMALLHKHGDDCLMHEGELVRRGEKWVLRSDVAFPI